VQSWLLATNGEDSGDRWVMASLAALDRWLANTGWDTLQLSLRTQGIYRVFCGIPTRVCQHLSSRTRSKRSI
jgi:hypothetical protein